MKKQVNLEYYLILFKQCQESPMKYRGTYIKLVILVF